VSVEFCNAGNFCDFKKRKEEHLCVIFVSVAVVWFICQWNVCDAAF